MITSSRWVRASAHSRSALAETGAKVTAIEVDPAVLPVLREQVEPQGVRVVEGDARTLDWNGLLGEASSWSLVANLPYNVAVPLVVRVLEEAPQVSSLLVMVQREVGSVSPLGPAKTPYGAVSVKVAYWATAAVVARVPASVFVPRPKVESVVVRLHRHGDTDGGRRLDETLGRARHRGRTTACSPSCVRGSPTGARCCGVPSKGRCSRRRSPPPASNRPPVPRRCPSRGGSGSPGGSRQRSERGGVRGAATVEVAAPAKLTLSLQVTGVRPDGYHLLAAEFVTVNLFDTVLMPGAGEETPTEPPAV